MRLDWKQPFGGAMIWVMRRQARYRVEEKDKGLMVMDGVDEWGLGAEGGVRQTSKGKGTE
jgi:hypothetical protein